MDAKSVLGLFFFLIDLSVLALGAVLVFLGFHQLGSGSGEGDIKVVLEKIGQISGINGQVVVLLAGVAMILVALAYALKAYHEALSMEHGPIDTIRHFAPLRRNWAPRS